MRVQQRAQHPGRRAAGEPGLALVALELSDGCLHSRFEPPRRAIRLFPDVQPSETMLQLRQDEESAVVQNDKEMRKDAAHAIDISSGHDC